MELIYKHITGTFLISTELIRNKSFREKLDFVLDNEFKGFLRANHMPSNSMSFCFTDNPNLFLKGNHYSCSNSVYRSEDQIYYKDKEFDM